MPDEIHRLHGLIILELSPAGPTIATDRDAADAVAAGWSAGAGMVAIPIARLPADIFTLANGVLGGLLQKFVNYRMRVAIVGDITPAAAASGALRDFVRESNRGAAVWCVADIAALAERLTAGSA